MAGQTQAFPGHLGRRLMTGRSRGEKRELIPGEIQRYVPVDGGMTTPFPVTFGGFEGDPLQGAIDFFKSSLWAKALVVGGTILLLYYTHKRAERGW